jgi:hypothetical protein
MSTELLNLILAITAIITTITLIITLAIVAWQTAQTAKQTKLNSIISYHQYYKDIDVALLQIPKLTEPLIGESQEDELADLLLGVLELSYKLQKEQLMERSSWKSNEATVIYTMKLEFIRRRWEKIKDIYDQGFVQFIDRKLQELDSAKQISS